MFHCGNNHYHPDAVNIGAWISESKGLGMVHTPDMVYRKPFALHRLDYSSGTPKISVIICATRPPQSLAYFEKTKYKNFEVIIVIGKGDLPKARNFGWDEARGSIIAHIDDDVVPGADWLEVIDNYFEDKTLVGLTGPTLVRHHRNRDALKYKKLYSIFEPSLPAHISNYGAPSYKSNFIDGCDYEGPCDYLECCNFVMRNSSSRFDEGFVGTGEWAEVDLAMKYSQLVLSPHKLWYTSNLQVLHNVSQAGVYVDRLKTKHRWENFKRFQDRWFDESIKFFIFGFFVWSYFKWKEFTSGNHR